MSVQIHINGENAGEAIRELSELASHLTPSIPTLTTGGTQVTEAPKTEKPARTRSTAKAAEPAKEEDSVDKSPEEAEQLSESEPDPIEDDEPVITVEQLRAKAGEVAKSGKQAEVKALLTAFEAASISALPEDKRAEFMKVLEAL